MKEFFKSLYFRAFCILLVVFLIYSSILIKFLGQITSFDLSLLHWVREVFSFLPTCVVVAITDFGFSSWFLPAYTFAFGYLTASKKYITLAGMSCMYLCFAPAIHVLKDIFQRERPDVLLHRVAETGFSFPSGHSTTAFYIAVLGIFLVSKFVGNNIIKNILITLIALWAPIVLFTRVWLGVHYPSDVLGGALYGSLLACFVITIIQTEYQESK